MSIIFRRIFTILISLVLPIQIYTQDEQTTYTIGYWLKGISDDSLEIAEQFVIELESELAEHGWSVEFFRYLSDEDIRLEDYIAELQFSEVLNDEKIIVDIKLRVFIGTQLLKPISPLLQSNQIVDLINNSPSDISPFTKKMTLAMLLYTLGDNQPAEELLLELHENTQELDSAAIAFYLSNIKIIQEEYQAAINIFEDFIWDDSRQFRGVNIAWAYLQLGQSDTAIELLTEAIESTASSQNELTYLLSVRAQLHALAFDYDSAIADIDEAILLNLDDAQLFNIRGNIITLIYEWDRALSNYDAALDLDPSYADTYFNRGILLYTMTRREDALADFEMYLELAPNGLNAQEAIRYINSITIELDALDNE